MGVFPLCKAKNITVHYMYSIQKTPILPDIHNSDHTSLFLHYSCIILALFLDFYRNFRNIVLNLLCSEIIHNIIFQIISLCLDLMFFYIC